MQFIQSYMRVFFDRLYLGFPGYGIRPFEPGADIQFMKHKSCIMLHIIIGSGINLYLSVLFFHNNSAGNGQLHKMACNQLCFNAKQPSCLCSQDILRQICVAVLCRLHQGIQNAAADAEIRICTDSCTSCNFIRDFKSHALDIVSQAVWIFTDNGINLRAVGLIHLRSQRQGNAKLLQEYHGLAHSSFFFHLCCNFLCLALTDAPDFGQPFGFFLNDAECVPAKFTHNPCCKRCTDSFDRSRA